MIAIGDSAPGFRLPDTDGVERGPQGAPATVLVFTCNHCPYALAWHERMVALAADYASHGVEVLAINPNDATRKPADSPERMRSRVLAGEFGGVPYLRDETQEVARGYGALTTPDVFVLDATGSLRYRGALDCDHGDPAQNAAWVRGALDALLAGREPDPAQTESIGCSVKWRV